jgi:predicted unusual protein kinase regulating ubiquinone biosynthesis (AarF/ABC1/UbiB family)
LRSELGAEKFATLTIEAEPLASASIAQVHRATLADGSAVVVKVQRPGLAPLIAADMQILKGLAEFAMRVRADAKMANPVGIVADFTATLNEEIDFEKEADNLDRFNTIMGELGHQHVRAPVPVRELSTTRVLTMERFNGTRGDAVEELRARGINGEDALVEGLRAWFQSVVFYGFFHGDVHAGNLMILDNGDIGFIDFGIVGRFDDRQRYLVTDWMVAFASGNFRMLAATVMAMGGAPSDVNVERFVAGLEEVYRPLLEMSFGDFNMAEAAPGLQRVARENNMTLPREFVLITKQLLYFDRYAKILAPTLNIFKDPRLITGMILDIQKARSENVAAS